MVHIPSGRRFPPVAQLFAAIVLLVVGSFGLAGRAVAEPGDPVTPGNEGSTPTLAQALEDANRGWLDAKSLLDSSKKRQADLATQQASVEQELAPVTAEVNVIAAAAYRTGGLRSASALLSSRTPDSFMERSMMVTTITRYNDRQLHKLNKLQKELAAARAAIDAEVTTQQQQADVMSGKKKELEKALALAGGKATGGFVSVTSPLAQPAPRNTDGSWPRESCIIDDPTTSGCVTSRTLHALKQAKSAGFTHFVSCYRSGGPFEHPKGRACDFAAQTSGFGGVATGNDRLYGNNLAAYFVRNAGALAVLYVIWFKQVWTPAVGWHRYSGGGGDPASDHTNHVHLSVY